MLDRRLWGSFLLKTVSALFCALGVIWVGGYIICTILVLDVLQTKTRAECEGDEGEK